MKKWSRIFGLWGKAIQALFVTPKIWIPLLIMLGIHLSLLYGLFLFPRLPLKIVLGPIVKRFFGERFLHYPFNFLLLPHLAKMARQTLAVLLDFYFIGVLAVLANDFWEKRPLRLKTAFQEALFKIFPLLAYSLGLVIIMYLVQKVPVYLFKTVYNSALVVSKDPEFYNKINLGLFYSLKVISIIIQAFFIYTIPFLVVGENSFLESVDKSFQTAFRNIFTTLFIVLIPALMLLGLEQFINEPKNLIEEYFPEIVLLILIGVEILQVLFHYLIIMPITAIAYPKSNQ